MANLKIDWILESLGMALENEETVLTLFLDFFPHKNHCL